MKQRVRCAAMVLIFVAGMMWLLLDHGYPMTEALAGASGAGVAAAEIVRRIVGGGNDPSTGALLPA